MGIAVVQSAITALALLILGNAFQQMHAAEIGPQSVGVT